PQSTQPILTTTEVPMKFVNLLKLEIFNYKSIENSSTKKIMGRCQYIKAQDKYNIQEILICHPNDKLYIAKKTTKEVATDFFEINKISAGESEIAVDNYCKHMFDNSTHQSKQFKSDLIEYFGCFTDSNNLLYTTTNAAFSHNNIHQKCVQDQNSTQRKKRYLLVLTITQNYRSPSDPFRNCDLKAASGTRNAFNLMYIREKQNTRISEYDETDSFYSYEQVLPKYQKANVQDESVGQSSDTFKSSKVFKFGGSLFRSPAWKWFKEIYIDKVWHGQCNIEMVDKKPSNTKTKTGDSTIALWRHLKIAHGYSKMTAQQLNKKQTTITKLFETFLSKPHSITEQAIHDRAITEIVISQNLSFTFTEDKMFK
ncbi:26601_t:CDS:2, partial [Gigaspora margarita]